MPLDSSVQTESRVKDSEFYSALNVLQTTANDIGLYDINHCPPSP